MLDVPEDIAHGEFDYPKSDFFVDPETLSIPAQRPRPGRDAIARAAERLRDARRPIILAGGGVHLSGAYCELQSFAEAFSIPVAQTLSGKGAIPCIHPLSVGLFGRWSRIANDLIESSDCILSVGCKMGEIATKRYDLIPRDVPFIHLDIVAEEIGRTTPTTVSLWGDAAEGLRDLRDSLFSDRVAMQQMRAAYLTEISERMAAWRAEAEPRYASDERPVNMARVVRAVAKRDARRRYSRCGWWICRALDWLALQFNPVWAHVYCQPRICIYRLRVAGDDGRATRSGRFSRCWPDWGCGIQYGAWRTGDGPAS